MIVSPQPNKIYLASRSPRRAELLKQLGIDFIVLPSDIDESPHFNEKSDDYVLRLASEKSQSCYESLEAHQMTIYPVLAADTTVSIDGTKCIQESLFQQKRAFQWLFLRQKWR